MDCESGGHLNGSVYNLFPFFFFKEKLYSASTRVIDRYSIEALKNLSFFSMLPYILLHSAAEIYVYIDREHSPKLYRIVEFQAMGGGRST